MEEKLSSLSTPSKNTKSAHASSSCYTASPTPSKKLPSLNKNANFITQQKNFDSGSSLNLNSPVNNSDHLVVILKHSKKDASLQTQTIDSSNNLKISNIEPVTNNNAKNLATNKNALIPKTLDVKSHLNHFERVLRSNAKNLATIKNALKPNNLDVKTAATEINDCKLTNTIKQSSKNMQSIKFTEEIQSYQFRQPIVGIKNIQDSLIIKPLSHEEHLTTLINHNANELMKCSNKNKIFPDIQLPQIQNQFSIPSPDKSSFAKSDWTATDNFQDKNANTSSLSLVSSLPNNITTNISECCAKLESLKSLCSTLIVGSSASECIPESTSIDKFESSKSIVEKTTNEEVDAPLYVEKVVTQKNVLLNESDVKYAETEINDCQLTNTIEQSSKNKQSQNFTEKIQNCQFRQSIVGIKNIQDSAITKPLSHKEHMTTLTKQNANELTKCVNKMFPEIQLPQSPNKFSSPSPDESSSVISDCTATDNFRNENANTSSLSFVSTLKRKSSFELTVKRNSSARNSSSCSSTTTTPDVSPKKMLSLETLSYVNYNSNSSSVVLTPKSSKRTLSFSSSTSFSSTESISPKDMLSSEHMSPDNVSSTSSSVISTPTVSTFKTLPSVSYKKKYQTQLAPLLSEAISPLNDSSLISEPSTLNVKLNTYLTPLSETIANSQYNSNQATETYFDNSNLTPSFLKNGFNSTDNTNLSKSLSEYFPDSTIDENFTSRENTFEEPDKSVEEIQNPIKVFDLQVPHRSHISKKHFCIFCKTLQTKLPRHFFLKHKSEKIIKEALNLPPKSKDRLKIIEELRKKGDFLHNTSEEHNSGILIVSRRQQQSRQNKADDYACCKNCRGFFSKNTLRIHLRNCGQRNKNARDNLISGRKITQYIHAAANFTLRTKIFPVLRNDDVTKAIRYDELIIKYGNKLSEKYTLTHQYDMIRSQLRLLGRFIIELKKLNESIAQLKDIFKPGLFDTCITALRIVANWDNTLMWFKTPAVAQNMTSIIKKCGSKQRTEYIKSQSEALKKELEDFLLLWEEEIPVLINKKAFDDQCNQKRIKKIILPSKDDIKKLYSFLKTKMIESIAVLETKFCVNDWHELVKSTLIFIQIFNRRRAGEIERLTISNYLNKEVITENIEKEILEKMSKESVNFAKQFVRLTLRGKLGRTVSVLLSPLSAKAIDLIIKLRTKAGITKSNDYIFSKNGNSKFSKQYYRACPLLNQYSLECGADIPQSLRGTTLRKHIATYTSLLNIEEASVDQLANFMGHHKDIHKSIYRVSVPVAEITCVSKLLMSAIGEDDDKDDEGNDDDMEDECNDNIELRGIHDNVESNSNNNSATSTTKKKRSTSPYGKTKRRKWTQEERDAIFSVFGDLKEMEKLPSGMKCLEAINNNPALRNRTPQQLKTWIDNQRRYK